MSVLSSLSVDEKLDLIAKLTNSIRNTYTKEQDIETEDPFACYEGVQTIIYSTNSPRKVFILQKL